MLTLADDFRTIDWVKEYPFPSVTLNEIEKLIPSSNRRDRNMLVSSAVTCFAGSREMIGASGAIMSTERAIE